MDKSKILNIVAFALLVVLIVAVLVVGFFSYKLIFPTVKEEISVNYEDLSPKDIITVTLENEITSNLKAGEDGKAYFAIVDMSYEIANLEEYEEEVTELMAIMAANEVVIRRIVVSEVRQKTYEEALSNEIYSDLADAILEDLQQEFDSELICNVIINKVIAG